MKTALLLLTACCFCLADSPTAAENNTPAQKSEPPNFWKETPRAGPNVYGYFEGRSPCQEIAKLLNVSGRESCIKIKWQLILFQDSVTRVPTTYALGGFAWRNPPKTGKWNIAK